LAKHSTDILTWARRGAEARWQELQTELASLKKVFPHLGSAYDADELPISFIVNRDARRAGARRRRKPMTAAQRNAVGARMKKYWAARRKAEK
jgi:hypothetical protein